MNSCGFCETVCAMALHLLMNCDYCGRSAISFCKGDRCGQNNELNKFLCDECVGLHQFCRHCQDVIKTDGQAPNTRERTIGEIDVKYHVSIIRKGLRQCAYCGSSETDRKKLKSCGACKCAFYCDAICQEEDWQRHKSLSCYDRKKICLNCKEN